MQEDLCTALPAHVSSLFAPLSLLPCPIIVKICFLEWTNYHTHPTPPPFSSPFLHLFQMLFGLSDISEPESTWKTKILHTTLIKKYISACYSIKLCFTQHLQKLLSKWISVNSMGAFSLKIPNYMVSSGFLTIVFDINELLIKNKTETSLWIDISMQTQAFSFHFIFFN